ncbi:hypothetical protein M0802_003917 [Mischocyttarus mexicanus]|nr:hypothetical protein M0802_003917 [Mischocyttarus mexicanus]
MNAWNVDIFDLAITDPKFDFVVDSGVSCLDAEGLLYLPRENGGIKGSGRVKGGGGMAKHLRKSQTTGEREIDKERFQLGNDRTMKRPLLLYLISLLVSREARSTE